MMAGQRWLVQGSTTGKLWSVRRKSFLPWLHWSRFLFLAPRGWLSLQERHLHFSLSKLVDVMSRSEESILMSLLLTLLSTKL